LEGKQLSYSALLVSLRTAEASALLVSLSKGALQGAPQKRAPFFEGTQPSE